jgi:lipopolysaccharide transport system permease protein
MPIRARGPRRRVGSGSVVVLDDPHASMPVIVRERRTGWRAVDIGELIAYRDLFLFLVLRDIRVLYKQTVLGFGWAVIRPVFSMIVFSVIFGRLAKISSDGLPYPLFSFAALVPWTYFQTAVTQSTNSLVSAAQLVTKVYFPRAMVPLAPVVAGLVDFGVSLLVLGMLMAWYGVAPTAEIVFLPLMILVMVLSAASVGLWLSGLSVRYRDIRFAMQFVVQLLMYAAPVVWPASLIPERYRLLYGLYPMAGVIEGFRATLLGGTAVPWDLIAVGSASALVLFTTGLVYFRRTESLLADVA